MCCEFAEDPLGITHHPRLSWWVNDPRPAELQSAYEILAASTRQLLDDDRGDLWRSGRIAGTQCANVAYQGLPLVSGQEVFWKVRTCDSDGIVGAWSEVARFEMGLLSAAEWHAHWIGAPLFGSRARGVQVVALRREFTSRLAVKKARLFLASAGAVQVFVNGHSVGPVPGPVWTDYHARHVYHTFDVTRWLRAGENAVGVLLGDGAWAGSVGALGRNQFGVRPAFRAMLVLEDFAERTERWITDHRWVWRPSGVLAADAALGEHIDRVQEHIVGARWTEPGLGERGWFPADIVDLTHDASEPVAMQPNGARVVQALRPMSAPIVVAHHDNGTQTLIADFGEIIFGMIEMQVEAIAQDGIVIHYGLSEQEMDPVHDTFATFGEHEHETFAPKFNLRAFRFVSITLQPGATKLQELTALRVSATYAAGLALRTDHTTLNRLFEAAGRLQENLGQHAPLRGLRGPQALPDYGYARVWAATLALDVRNHGVLRKWVDDLVHGFRAREDGRVFDARSAGAAWDGDAIARLETLVELLWGLYRWQQDRELLERCYPVLRATALCARLLGDEALRQDARADLYGDGQSGLLVANCTFYGALRRTARIARVLGNAADEQLLEASAEKIRVAFARRFVTAEGYLAGDTLSAYVAALHYGLLDDAVQGFAQVRLVHLVRSGGYLPDVSAAVAAALLPALTRAGRVDVAYSVLLQTAPGSWLHSLDAADPKRQHVAGEIDPGAVGALQWALQSMLGVSLADNASGQGDTTPVLRVEPRPPLGSLFAAGAPLEFAELKFHTIWGAVRVHWHINADDLDMEVSLPPGASALVVLPDGIEHPLQSGEHELRFAFAAGGDGIPTLLEPVRDPPGQADSALIRGRG